MVGHWGPDLEGLWDHTPRDSARAPHWTRDPNAGRLVYFIAASEISDGPIKIGSSRKPDARLAALQSGCPVRLEILALCQGGFERERGYHLRFAADRLHGEWFARNDKLERLIRWHKSRMGLRSTG